MVYCMSCGAENADGMQFCVKCGAALAPSSGPGAWRAGSEQTTAEPSSGTANSAAGTYTPPPASYPTYTAPPSPVPYQGQSQGEPMHPAVAAIVSLFFPGIGLLFVPNKAGLGIGVFAGYLVLNIVLFVIAVVTIGIGSCLFLLVPLVNVLAAVHSWDEAAKVSRGKFQPLLFK